MFEEKPEGNGSLVEENQRYLGARHQANGKPGASGKARLSARQEANEKCDLPRKSLSMYTWKEIQTHNQETDQWLVINRKVYDVTGWADRHPGGREVLNYYAGEDATVRNLKSALSLSIPAAGWLGPWLSFQKHFKYVFKLHDHSSSPKPIFQDSYPAKSWKLIKLYLHYYYYLH